MKVKQLEKELNEKENTNKANQEQITNLLTLKEQHIDLYTKLEIEFNKLKLSLEEAKEQVNKAEMKSVSFEKESIQFKKDIFASNDKINELHRDLQDKKSKLEKDATKIDDLEKAITKVSEDFKKKCFECEILGKLMLTKIF